MSDTSKTNPDLDLPAQAYPSFRWLRRDGQLVLQQEWLVDPYGENTHDEWRDVPVVEAE